MSKGGGGGGGGGAKGGGVIIIKKKGDAGHHGGAWKVAYADFVTAMMALFMVLWLLSQTDQPMRKKIAEYFRNGVFSGAPSMLGVGNGLLNAASLDVQGNSMGADDDLLEQSAKSLKAALKAESMEGLQGHIQIDITKEGLLIQIVDGGDDLLFQVSSSELQPKLVEFLKKLGPILAKIPNAIQVHGHTDARPFPKGSNRDNWQLSFERANSSRAVLEESGMRKGQILGVFAHGSSSPLDPDPYSPRNRRLAILAVRRGLEQVTANGLAEPPEEAKPKPPRKKGTISIAPP